MCTILVVPHHMPMVRSQGLRHSLEWVEEKWGGPNENRTKCHLCHRSCCEVHGGLIEKEEEKYNSIFCRLVKVNSLHSTPLMEVWRVNGLAEGKGWRGTSNNEDRKMGTWSCPSLKGPKETMTPNHWKKKGQMMLLLEKREWLPP